MLCRRPAAQPAAFQEQPAEDRGGSVKLRDVSGFANVTEAAAKGSSWVTLWAQGQGAGLG